MLVLGDANISTRVSCFCIDYFRYRHSIKQIKKFT